MSGTEMTPEPDWLAAEPSAQRKLTAIMAAVRRCYAECPMRDASEATGPHMGTTMAELFLGQLLMKAAADEREAIPPTDQAIRAVAHNTLAAALTEFMKLSDRIRVSEAVAAAVEPLIRASEREACAQMAEQVGAGYYTREAILSGGIRTGSYEPFADLLRETP